MFTRPSQEFLSLCQNQLTLLNQNFGAGLSAVYLAADFAGEQLIPVAFYPDTRADWQSEMNQPRNQSQSPIAEESTLDWRNNSPLMESFMPRLPNSQPLLTGTAAYENTWQDDQGTWQRQVVIPLNYEGLAMGLLVTGRSDRPWRPKELAAVEKVAHSLAIARLLDQRSSWLDQQLKQQRTLASNHRDHLDNLLHQIRNPLTAIKTFGKLLLKRLQPADTNRSIITGLVQESDRLQSLLRQLDQDIRLEQQELDESLKPIPALAPAQSMRLSPAKSETEKILEPLVLTVVDINQVLQPLLVSAQAIAQDRGLEILTDLPEDLPLVMGDPAGLREVLSNLLDNALKYNLPKGLVFVKTLLERPGYLCLGLTNTGKEIPAADLPYLFQRHYRGVQETGTIVGTGLGLAIAQQLLERMGAEIEVLSPSSPEWVTLQGQDYPKDEFPAAAVLTTFLVYLPLAVLPLPFQET